MFQRERAPQQMIEDAPRRAHDDVRALAQRLDLRAVPDAAVHRHGAQSGGAAQQFRILRHLAGQLARRREDERLALGARRVEACQHRQQIRAGLAAARARLDHHPPPGKQVGDRARLHRHQRRPPGAGCRGAQWFRELVEGNVGQRILWSIGYGRYYRVHKVSIPQNRVPRLAAPPASLIMGVYQRPFLL